jgi:Tetratricopeptide repeat
MIERLLEAERALAVGLLDQAEHLYQQAWEADPHNSIAVAGLARVALERGDEATAHALALRALDIDEDNPAARRLVDRLVELQAARGAVRPAPGAAGPATPSAAAEPTKAEPTKADATRAEPEPSRPPAAEKSRPARPHVAPPAAIRTSSSGKRRTSPPPAATGPTLPKARPLSPATPKPPPAERPGAAAPQPAPARPAAKRPAAPRTGNGKTGDSKTGDGKTNDGKSRKEPGLLDRLFGPRR